MSSFLKTASKQVADARTFLREAAGANTIKYSAEKGARHLIYIPYLTQEVVDEATNQKVAAKTLYAISGDVHEWRTVDGKFKATVCAKDKVRMADDGVTMLNNGSCPFCDRVSDSWEIYNYRKELEENSCQLTGEQRKNHLDKTFSSFRDEMKAKQAKSYMYILVVKFRTGDNGKEVLGSDGLPEYDLKVMKLSASRVEKIQQQVVNSGSELPGSELIFEYPNVEDIRLVVGQSTTTPVFPSNMLTTRYPNMLNSINNAVAKFEWDGLEKAFPEWAGMTTAEAETVVNNMFEQWDMYKKELLSNPQAKYLEYVVTTPSAKPSLDGAASGGMAIPTIPTIPTVPGATGTEAPTVPTVPPVPTIPTVPTVPGATGTEAPTVPPVPPVPGASEAANANSVFAGNGPEAPTITV